MTVPRKNNYEPIRARGQNNQYFFKSPEGSLKQFRQINKIVPKLGS